MTIKVMKGGKIVLPIIMYVVILIATVFIIEETVLTVEKWQKEQSDTSCKYGILIGFPNNSNNVDYNINDFVSCDDGSMYQKLDYDW